MKTKSKSNRNKTTTDKTRQIKKPKKTTKQLVQSDVYVRRSVRISERQLQLHYSLPDNDDSENEADEGALQELLELSECEDNMEIDDIDQLCSDDEVNMSDGDCSETLQQHVCHKSKGTSSNTDSTWDCNTEYFDKLNKTFENSAGTSEDIGQTEKDFFESIFDNQVMLRIISETNRYAKQNNSKDWVDVTAEEMKAFFGTLIVMGIHQLPALKHYWSSDPFLHVESVSTVMTANRFKKIIENLHCNDNETQTSKSDPNYDKLHKVKPLLEVLNENVRKVYKPSSVVTVDESMIPFKGRYTLKQYMPNKPVKWGYKVWCLCDSYTGMFTVYILPLRE